MVAIREPLVKADLSVNVLEVEEAEPVGYIAAKLVGSAVDTKAVSTAVGQTGQIPKLFVGEIEVE